MSNPAEVGRVLLDALDLSEGNYCLIRRGLKDSKTAEWRVNVRARGQELVAASGVGLQEALTRAVSRLRKIAVLACLLIATPLSAQTITNLTPTGYQQGSLVVGSNYYIDRTYTLTAIPASVAGGRFILPANNDKNFTGTTHIQFTVDMPVKVFIAYDSRATALPAWMATWVITPDTLETTDAPLRLYVKDFPSAGQITLGGNLQAPADAGTHYSVVVKPLSGTPVSWPNPGFTVTLTKESGLVLDWTDMSDNEEAFEVERRVPAGVFALLATLPMNTQTYQDSNLVSGATWCYRVRATNSAGTSAYSNEACGTSP